MDCLPRSRFAEWILDQVAELMSGIIWLYIILFREVLLNVLEGIYAMCCAPWPWIRHPASRLKSSLVILDRWKFILQTYFILQSMSDSKKKKSIKMSFDFVMLDTFLNQRETNSLKLS